ncbi:MAG TPA: hypothetical protein IAC82_00610 [Candidatus Merdivicinus intestinigallinarum]|nr:hypothetical protein [Candidatus Merdivicinus intestinigallinarum]
MKKKWQKLLAVMIATGMSLGLVNWGAVIATAAEEEPVKELSSVDLPDDIPETKTVDYGTTQEELGLPETLVGTIKVPAEPINETPEVPDSEIPAGPEDGTAGGSDTDNTTDNGTTDGSDAGDTTDDEATGGSDTGDTTDDGTTGGSDTGDTTDNGTTGDSDAGDTTDSETAETPDSGETPVLYTAAVNDVPTNETDVTEPEDKTDVTGTPTEPEDETDVTGTPTEPADDTVITQFPTAPVAEAPRETVEEVNVPVTWTSEPEYNGDNSGRYTFTPTLGAGYSYDGTLPTITVTVKPQDGNVAQIVGKPEKYDTLDKAIAAAADGDTIELLTDCEITQVFDKELTFTGTGKITIDTWLTNGGTNWWTLTKDLTFQGPDISVEWIAVAQDTDPEEGNQSWLLVALSSTINVLDGAHVTFKLDNNETSVTTLLYPNDGTTSAINVAGGSTLEFIGQNTLGVDGQAIQMGGGSKFNINVTGSSTFLIDGTNRGYTGSPNITVKNSTFTVQNCTNNASNGGSFTAIDSEINFLNNRCLGLSTKQADIRNSILNLNGNGYSGWISEGEGTSVLVDGDSEVYISGNGGLGGDFAALKIDHDAVFKSGAVVSITNNAQNGLHARHLYSQWSNSTPNIVFEDGVDLTITGNGKDAEYGGGIWNQGTVVVPADAVIYNNHASIAGDDIYSDDNSTAPEKYTATITFGPVGSDWVLDDCDHAIDGWYYDGNFDGSRWSAHEKPYYVQEYEIAEAVTETGLLALKAAHDGEPMDPGDPDLPDWTTSKSKTATNLDNNYESQVTLSLPAADYKPEIDVMFVIDDTHAGSGIFAPAAEKLLMELKDKDNLDINVGIVTFDSIARDWLSVTSGGTLEGLVSLDEYYDEICTAIETVLSYESEGQQRKIGGSNLEWSLDLAGEILAEGSGSEQHVIMFSDMYGYVYRGNLTMKNGTTYENVPLSKRLGTYNQGQLCISSPKYSTWEEVYANRTDDEVPDTFFRDSSWSKYWATYSGESSIPNIEDAPKDSAPQYDEDLNPYHYFIPFEKSSCLTYDQICALMTDGVQITIVNNDFNPGDTNDGGPAIREIKNEMLNDLSGKGVTVIQKETANGATFNEEEMEEVFTVLKNELVYLVDKGSKVVDVMGYGTDNDGNAYNFDFVNDMNKLTLTVGGEKLDKTEIIDPEYFGATSGYAFGMNEDGSSQFALYYYPNGQDGQSDECFVWEINVPIEVGNKVQLTYSVKLTNPQTDPGDYGVFDADGSEGYSSLLTNKEATLYPVDSNGEAGVPENFAKPTVSYTVGSGEPSEPTDPTDPTDPYVPVDPDPDEEIDEPETPLEPGPGEEIDEPETPLAPGAGEDAVPGGPSEAEESIDDEDTPKTDAPPQTGRQIASGIILLAGAAAAVTVILRRKEQ